MAPHNQAQSPRRHTGYLVPTSASQAKHHQTRSQTRSQQQQQQHNEGSSGSGSRSTPALSSSPSSGNSNSNGNKTGTKAIVTEPNTSVLDFVARGNNKDIRKGVGPLRGRQLLRLLANDSATTEPLRSIVRSALEAVDPGLHGVRRLACYDLVEKGTEALAEQELEDLRMQKNLRWPDFWNHWTEASCASWTRKFMVGWLARLDEEEKGEGGQRREPEPKPEPEPAGPSTTAAATSANNTVVSISQQLDGALTSALMSALQGLGGTTTTRNDTAALNVQEHYEKFPGVAQAQAQEAATVAGLRLSCHDVSNIHQEQEEEAGWQASGGGSSCDDEEQLEKENVKGKVKEPADCDAATTMITAREAAEENAEVPPGGQQKCKEKGSQENNQEEFHWVRGNGGSNQQQQQQHKGSGNHHHHHHHHHHHQHDVSLSFTEANDGSEAYRAAYIERFWAKRALELSRLGFSTLTASQRLAAMGGDKGLVGEAERYLRWTRVGRHPDDENPVPVWTRDKEQARARRLGLPEPEYPRRVKGEEGGRFGVFVRRRRLEGGE